MARPWTQATSLPSKPARDWYFLQLVPSASGQMLTKLWMPCFAKSAQTSIIYPQWLLCMSLREPSVSFSLPLMCLPPPQKNRKKNQKNPRVSKNSAKSCAPSETNGEVVLQSLLPPLLISVRNFMPSTSALRGAWRDHRFPEPFS